MSATRCSIQRNAVAVGRGHQGGGYRAGPISVCVDSPRSTVTLTSMIKKRTRPQPRIREPSPDLSDSVSKDVQQQTNNQDEAELPYVSGALCLCVFLFV